MLGHEGVLLLDVHLLQHLSRVLHSAPGHSRRMSGHSAGDRRPLPMMDHHHGRVHVRGLEVNLRLLEKVKTGGFWHRSGGLLLLNLLWWGGMLMLDLLRGTGNNLLLWLLLRGAGKYWQRFLRLLFRVVVAKPVIGFMTTAVAIGHLWLDDGLCGRHGVFILILCVLSVLSVVVILGGHVIVGLSVCGGVLSPLGLDVSRLADQVDQSVKLLVGAAGNSAGLWSEINKVN